MDSGDAPAPPRRTFDAGGDESVAEQVNDPTAFLRQVSLDTTVEHGGGDSAVTLEWMPTLAFPIGQRFRFEAGVPVLFNGSADPDEIEPGDVYASLSYIFFRSEDFAAFSEFRLDLPTGNERRGADLGVTQWHVSLGTSIYTFQAMGLLIIPYLEYRRSIFGGDDKAQVSSLIGSLGLVYLLSKDAYLRSDWTVNLDGSSAWQDSALVNFEIGQVFDDRYSVALSYEVGLWNAEEIRNAATVSLGYLF